MRREGPRFHVSALALGAALVSCGKARAPSAPPAPTAAASAAPAASGEGPAKPGAPAANGVEITPSRLLPELVGVRGLVANEDGQRRVLVDRMRLVSRADGSLERAAQLLPGGIVTSIALPSRLGGGYLFHVSGGGGTELWRAESWLGRLRPLAHRNENVTEIIPGFDRFYLRLNSDNRLIAIHPDTGEQMPLGPLPPASSYGALAFADGWRAIVDTDLRGPLATFDAGLTWRPMGLAEKPQGIGIFSGDPAVVVPGGRYVVDARGVVSHRTDTSSRKVDDDPAGFGKRPGPLGRRPLRAAIEDGWPDSKTTAIVARGGALARISLRDGATLAVNEDAYPDPRAACHAVRLGPTGVGFVCGERDAATVIYEHVPPLGMRPVMRFDKPRYVSAAGNGALTIRGRCAGEGAPADEADARWYCVRSVAGTTREIRIKGFDLGLERVIGLSDGRVAVVVPPRGGSAGDVSIVAVDGRATKATLRLPEEPREVRDLLKRGLWLDGFEERAPGVLGGWIEGGGPVLGVEIKLDGEVKAGELQPEAAGAILGGRFGVVMQAGARASETTDGGMTFATFDLPDREEEARAVPTRAVGPVGAALPGWVRVGWGAPESKDDMKPAESPSSHHLPLKVSPTIALACDLVSVATPPLPEKPKAAAPPPPPSRGRIVVASRTPVRREGPTPWTAFRNTAAPALSAEEVGYDHGSGENVLVRAYAWGKRGADWSRAGRWLVRFDDRFDVSGGVRSTALGASLWPDENAAHDAITGTSYGSSVNWTGFLDPSGRAMLAAGCRAGGSTCSIYAAAEGQPVLPLRDASGRAGGFLRPYPGAAVRLGDTWFFLSQSPSFDAVALWRVDLGVARTLATYHPTRRYGYESPRLVRRALGGGIGILLAGQPDPGERAGTWYVLPVDAETGVLGEATFLARRDFSSAPLSRCAPEQDGWEIDASDVTSQTAVAVDLDNARANIDAVEMRVRLDPGRACVEAFAGRTPGFYPLEPKGAPPSKVPAKVLTAAPGRKGGGDAASLIPFAVNERSTGRRWGMSCRLKPPPPKGAAPKPVAAVPAAVPAGVAKPGGVVGGVVGGVPKPSVAPPPVRPGAAPPAKPNAAKPKP